MITFSRLASVRFSPGLSVSLLLSVFLVAMAIGQVIGQAPPPRKLDMRGEVEKASAQQGPGHDTGNIYYDACADLSDELEWEACNLLNECAALQKRASDAGMEVVCMGGAL